MLMGAWGARVSLLGQVVMSSQMQWLSMLPTVFKGTGMSHRAHSIISQLPVRSSARVRSLPSKCAKCGAFRACCQIASNSGLGRSVFSVGVMLWGVPLMIRRLPSWNQWLR